VERSDRVVGSGGWKLLSTSIVLCGVLTAAGCDQPVSTPAQPTASAPPSATGPPTAADEPTVRGGPTASVLPKPSAAPTSPMLILFDLLGSGARRGAAEVTRPDRLDEFLDRFDIETTNSLDYSPREEVKPWRAVGARLFAFMLAGCDNDGAALQIESSRVYATLTGGLGVQCDTPVYYLAIFAVPAGLIADGAQIG
jgi:hypothetical protein